MGKSDEESDDERTEIRKELSHMSFGELMQLKERIGAKKYDEAMFGASSKPRGRNIDANRSFKRVNKNRPREMSSKLRVDPLIDDGLPKQKKLQTRDPRFDSMCGEFKDGVFRKAYNFVNDIRSQEKDELKEQLKTEMDPEKKAEIKYLIQRMENQAREHQKRQQQEEKEAQEKRERVELLKRGEKPQYLNKAERKTKELVEKFEELKKSGKISKHIEKHRKKKNIQDRKRYKELK